MSNGYAVTVRRCSRTASRAASRTGSIAADWRPSIVTLHRSWFGWISVLHSLGCRDIESLVSWGTWNQTVRFKDRERNLVFWRKELDSGRRKSHKGIIELRFLFQRRINMASLRHPWVWKRLQELLCWCRRYLQVSSSVRYLWSNMGITITIAKVVNGWSDSSLLRWRDWLRGSWRARRRSDRTYEAGLR